jgi:hypothetical protein
MMVGLLACLMSGMVFMHARRLLNRGARDDTDPVTPS